MNSEDRFKQLYEYAPTPYHTLTPEGRITDVNRKWCQILGYEKQEVIGKSIFDFVVEEEQEAAKSSFEQKKLSHRTFTGGEHERGYLTKDKKIRTFVTNDFLSFDEKDNITSVHTTMENVTERKKIEQDLRDANIRLSHTLTELKRTEQQIIQHARLSALGQMASGIAHDFNNALMPILGFSDLMINDPNILKDREETLSMLKDINAAARDAAQTIMRLRDFYRPSDEGERVPVDMNKLIETVLALTKPKWREEMRALGLTVEIRKELQEILPVSGNESQLRDALTNVILNAVDAMPRGGTITISSYIDRKWSVIEVNDTGTGMTDEVRERCFDPFFTTKELDGTGMGLSVAYGTIRQHGGTIDVLSEPDRGTTFVIRLPWETALSEKTDGETKAVDSLSPLRVLIIDDEIWSRSLVQRFLTSNGHSVEAAKTGKEGLEMFGKGTFDLVITDRAMPDMSGDQVAAEIKKAGAETSIILLTGFGDLMKSAGESPPGIDMILSKPVTKKELFDAIMEVMTPNPS